MYRLFSILPVQARTNLLRKMEGYLGAALLLCGFTGVALPQISQPSPEFTQAESYLQQRQYDRAIALLQEVLEASPNDPMAHNRTIISCSMPWGRFSADPPPRRGTIKKPGNFWNRPSA